MWQSTTSLKPQKKPRRAPARHSRLLLNLSNSRRNYCGWFTRKSVERMAKDPYKYFRVEARELADQLSTGILDLERGAAAPEIVPRLLRVAHTLKGAAGVVKQIEIAEAAHAIEDVLVPFREDSAP